MFLTSEDFNQLPYNIQNISDNVGFQQYVEDAEEEILLKLFGSSFYTSFLEGLYSDIAAKTKRDEADIAAKWKTLRDGGAYNIVDIEYNWLGIKGLLKPYIYSMWTRDNFDNDSGQGIVAPNFENGEAISPSARIVRAFNKFSLIAGNICMQENTLFGFLSNSTYYEDDFDGNFADFASYINFFFQDQGSMNLWNL